MKNGSMVTWFFPRMKVTTIAEIHSIQITYLILFLQPCFADLSLHLATHSCSPPAGQRYPQKGRGSPEIHGGKPCQGNRPGGTPVPRGSRDQPRHGQADQLLWHDRADRGFRGSSGHPQPAHPRSGPVGLSLPDVPCGCICRHQRRRGTDPAELLRLRSGRGHHRPGGGDLPRQQ